MNTCAFRLNFLFTYFSTIFFLQANLLQKWEALSSPEQSAISVPFTIFFYENIKFRLVGTFRAIDTIGHNTPNRLTDLQKYALFHNVAQRSIYKTHTHTCPFILVSLIYCKTKKTSTNVYSSLIYIQSIVDIFFLKWPSITPINDKMFKKKYNCNINTNLL